MSLTWPPLDELPCQTEFRHALIGPVRKLVCGHIHAHREPDFLRRPQVHPDSRLPFHAGPTKLSSDEIGPLMCL